MRSLLPALFLSIIACGRGDDRTADAREPIPPGIDPAMVEWRSDGVLIPSPDSLRKTPGYIIDSILPPDEALRRLQQEVTDPIPTRLTGGADSRSALIRAYWDALQGTDTTRIRTLVLSKAEFAYLYFPESAPFASGMQPVPAWVLYEAQSGRGLTAASSRAREAAAGRAVLRDVTCRAGGRTEGTSETSGPCGVVLRWPDQRIDTLWIVSTVIRRDGRYKLLGLDNAL